MRCKEVSPFEDTYGNYIERCRVLGRPPVSFLEWVKEQAVALPHRGLSSPIVNDLMAMGRQALREHFNLERHPELERALHAE